MSKLRKFVSWFRYEDMKMLMDEITKKVEIANEKSNNLKERMKKSFEDLCAIATNKLNSLFRYSGDCQKKLFFSSYLLKQIKSSYWSHTLRRLSSFLQIHSKRRSLLAIARYAAERAKETRLEGLLENWRRDKRRREQSVIFNAMRGCLVATRHCFERMARLEDAFAGVRLSAGFAAIERRSFGERAKAGERELAGCAAKVKIKEGEVRNLEQRRKEMEEQLVGVFGRFIGFQ
jgi:hypothetical protein